MAGRTKYSQEQRDCALAALMASAVEQDDGSWAPQFRDVSRSLSIHHVTLQRWWKGRDVDQDGPLRTSCTRARSEVREEGAKSWIDAQLESIKKGIKWVVSEDRLTDDARPDAIARALKDAVHVAEKVDALTKDAGSRSPGQRVAGLRRAAGQVGLTRSKK